MWEEKKAQARLAKEERVANEGARLAAYFDRMCTEKAAAEHERIEADRRERDESERREAEVRERQRARFARLRGVEGATPTDDPPESCRLVITGPGADGTVMVELRAGAAAIAPWRVRVARVLEMARSVSFWSAAPGGDVPLFLVRDEADRVVLVAADGRTAVG